MGGNCATTLLSIESIIPLNCEDLATLGVTAPILNYLIYANLLFVSHTTVEVITIGGIIAVSIDKLTELHN